MPTGQHNSPSDSSRDAHSAANSKESAHVVRRPQAGTGAELTKVQDPVITSGARPRRNGGKQQCRQQLWPWGHHSRTV